MFEEFEKMSNAEAYRRAFHELLMLPDPQKPGNFLGNSQREYFLPFLKKILKEIAPKDVVKVFDVGAGSGEIVDIALSALKSGVVSIEEPNSLLLKRYRSEIEKYNNLKLGSVYPGTVQDLYRSPTGTQWFDSLPPQDVILALHMIYHLTPFATEDQIAPEDELIEMLSALYGKLAIGGSLVVVYADQLKSMGGKIGYNHFQKRSPIYANNLRLIWIARNHLIKNGTISGILDSRYPQTLCEINVKETPSKFFARSLEELTVLNLSGELGTSDEDQFDVTKLHTAYEFISSYANDMGVSVEVADGPRKGMVGGNQPQIICELKKHSR